MKKTLFIDIETVGLHPNFHELSEIGKHLWPKKHQQIIKSNEINFDRSRRSECIIVAP